MKVVFTAVGKPQAQWAKGAVAHYERFLKKYAQTEWNWVRSVSPAGRKPADVRRLEGKRLLDAVSRTPGFKIACDSTGQSFDSKKFANHWQEGTDRHGGRAVVLVGGAWGLDQSVLDWADSIWSFGASTYPHELALIIAAEQIARALSILRGDSYHK